MLTSSKRHPSLKGKSLACLTHLEIHSCPEALILLGCRKSLETQTICPNLCIYCEKRKNQWLKITTYWGNSQNPCVALNPLVVSENLALKQTAESTIPMEKKPFALWLPTELGEYTLTETHQICQDLCKQNYPFTNSKQICAWTIESHNRNIYCLLSSSQWVEGGVRSYCCNISEEVLFFSFKYVRRYAWNSTHDYRTPLPARFLATHIKWAESITRTHGFQLFLGATKEAVWGLCSSSKRKNKDNMLPHS